MKYPYNINSHDRITYNDSPISELSDLPQKYQKMVCAALNIGYYRGMQNLQDNLKALLDIREHDHDAD